MSEGLVLDHEHTDPDSDRSLLRGRRREFWVRWGLLFLALPLAGGLAGLLLDAVTPPSYTAHSYVLITLTGEGGEVVASDIAQALARVATSESVIASNAPPADDLLQAAREDRLTASASPDAPLIDLAATAGTAREAAELADDLARQLSNHVASIEDVADVRVTLLSSAYPPSRPTSPNTFVNVLAGMALGVIAASLLFVLRRR